QHARCLFRLAGLAPGGTQVVAADRVHPRARAAPGGGRLNKRRESPIGLTPSHGPRIHVLPQSRPRSRPGLGCVAGWWRIAGIFWHEAGTLVWSDALSPGSVSIKIPAASCGVLVAERHPIKRPRQARRLFRLSVSALASLSTQAALPLRS